MDIDASPTESAARVFYGVLEVSFNIYYILQQT